MGTPSIHATLAGALLLLAAAPVFASSNCEALKGCQRKFCEIETQLNIAQDKGYSQKANGLKKSLKQARKNCSDESLWDDLVEEIAETKAEISEYEVELAQAKQAGKPYKVLKYQKKIDTENRKLKRLTNELANLE